MLVDFAARVVGPEARVALLLERSLDLIVAVFATFKAGGAYVPLDPAAPPERLVFLLGDAAPKVVVTNPGLRERLPESGVRGIRTILLGGDWTDWIDRTDPSDQKILSDRGARHLRRPARQELPGAITTFSRSTSASIPTAS